MPSGKKWAAYDLTMHLILAVYKHRHNLENLKDQTNQHQQY